MPTWNVVLKHSIGRLWPVFALMLFSGTARADFLIFNGTTDPLTGDYIPVGAGNFGAPGAFVGFTAFPQSFVTPLFGPGVEGGAFSSDHEEFAPYNPNSPMPCITTFAPSGYCVDFPQFVISNTGAPGNGVDIYDSTGNLLAFMYADCAANALCAEYFYSGIGGIPLDASNPNIQCFILGPCGAGPRATNIVATGGIQDAIDLYWYDGTNDSIEFILNPIPEPSSLVLLGTIVLGLGAAFKRRSLVVKPPPAKPSIN